MLGTLLQVVLLPAAGAEVDLTAMEAVALATYRASGEPWGITHGIRSLFKWPQHDAAPPLPPLTSSGLRGLHEDGHHAGGVHRPAAPSTRVSHPNARAACL